MKFLSLIFFLILSIFSHINGQTKWSSYITVANNETYLTASNLGLTSLFGLEWFTNITILDLNIEDNERHDSCNDYLEIRYFNENF